MSVTKTLVVLANSHKPGGRCLAGIELEDWKPAGWVRPVSDRATHGLNPRERQFPDGSEPVPLDVVEVQVGARSPTGFQHENWLVDPTAGLVKKEVMSCGAAERLVAKPRTLWLNGHSTQLGINDRVPASEFPNIEGSIMLVKTSDLKLEVAVNPWNHEPQVRAMFNYRGTRYKFRVTDPQYADTYAKREVGNYKIGEAYLTLSLSEPWSGDASKEKDSYKLVAAVIQP